MFVKEDVFVLVSTLERIRKRGFGVKELVERLYEKGIMVKPQTLTKYLSEFRQRKEKKRDPPSHLEKTVTSASSAPSSTNQIDATVNLFSWTCLTGYG